LESPLTLLSLSWTSKKLIKSIMASDDIPQSVQFTFYSYIHICNSGIKKYDVIVVLSAVCKHTVCKIGKNMVPFTHTLFFADFRGFWAQENKMAQTPIPKNTMELHQC
jgi:hypothetical protein